MNDIGAAWNSTPMRKGAAAPADVKPNAASSNQRRSLRMVRVTHSDILERN
jgi:hypothetical protein